MQESYLAHHGIKGQKWGIRRYQNPDGSLTAEGERRYGSIEKFHKSKDYRKYRKEQYKTNISKLQKQTDKDLEQKQIANEKANQYYKEQYHNIRKGYKEHGLTRREAKDLIYKVRDIYEKGTVKIDTNLAKKNHETARAIQKETMKYYEDIGKTNSRSYRLAKNMFENNESWFSNYHLRKNSDGTFYITRYIG